MSNWQQARVAMRGFAYFGTGIVLIIGSLVMLGIIMDALSTSYYVIDGQMPELVKWTPLFIMLVMIGWGAYFINKGINIGGQLFIRLLGKAIYKILQLRRIPYSYAILLGGVMALAGFLIVCIKVGPAIKGEELPIDSPSIVITGIALIILGMATVEYTAAKRNQDIAQNRLFEK